jgi:hypothetical protein
MGDKRAAVAGLIRDVFALALRVPHPRRRRDLRRRGHDLIAVRAGCSSAWARWEAARRGAALLVPWSRGPAATGRERAHAARGCCDVGCARARRAATQERAARREAGSAGAAR